MLIISSNSGQFHIRRTRRSSSASSIILTKQHVRLHAARRCSSASVDLLSRVVGTSLSHQIDYLSTRSKMRQQKQNKTLERFRPTPDLLFQSTTNNQNEKNRITSHSMMATKNMRLPPTATVLINQTHRPSSMVTTSSSLPQKKSPSKKDLTSSHRPFTARSIPGLFRKTTSVAKPDFHLTIKSMHQ